MTYISDPNKYWAHLTRESLLKSLDVSKEKATEYFYQNDNDAEALKLKLEYIQYLKDGIEELLEEAKEEFDEL